MIIRFDNFILVHFNEFVSPDFNLHLIHFDFHFIHYRFIFVVEVQYFSTPVSFTSIEEVEESLIEGWCVQNYYCCRPIKCSCRCRPFWWASSCGWACSQMTAQCCLFAGGGGDVLQGVSGGPGVTGTPGAPGELKITGFGAFSRLLGSKALMKTVWGVRALVEGFGIVFADASCHWAVHQEDPKFTASPQCFTNCLRYLSFCPLHLHQSLSQLSQRGVWHILKASFLPILEDWPQKLWNVDAPNFGTNTTDLHKIKIT